MASTLSGCCCLAAMPISLLTPRHAREGCTPVWGSLRCGYRTPESELYRSVQLSISGQLLRKNVKRFRGGHALKAHRHYCHSTLCWRVIKKRKNFPSVDDLRLQYKPSNLGCQNGVSSGPHRKVVWSLGFGVQDFGFGG